ncbi:MAG: rhodanese-like domain-containing protein [Brevinematia bacterium]
MLEEIDIIIDLRSQKEFQKDKQLYLKLGKEALNIAFFQAPKEIEKLDKEKSYLLVCETGSFSDIIAKVMLSKGFKKVKNLKGGIIELKEKIK